MTPKIVSPAAEVGAETPPLNTPKSYLTLSAGPVEHRLPDRSPAALAALRDERDPVTGELLVEKVNRRLARYVAPESEAEKRLAWGDR